MLPAAGEPHSSPRGSLSAASAAEARALTAEQQQIQHLQAAVRHLLDRQEAAAAAPPSSAVASGADLVALAAAVTAAQRPPLDDKLRFAGNTATGLVFDDWLEALEVHHTYYGRTSSADRIATTVALLHGTALKAHLQQSKELGAPASYDALIARLAKTWRLVLPFYTLHAKLTALVARGPAMKTDEYARAYSVLAGRIDDSQMNQFMKTHHFILGLRPSLRPAILAKEHATLAAAVAQVLQRDATQAASSSAALGEASPTPSDTSAAMDLSSAELELLSGQDRAACLAARDRSGLHLHGTPSSSSSASTPALGLSAVDVANLVASTVAAQLVAAGVLPRPDGAGDRRRVGSGGGGSHRGPSQSPRAAREVPEPLARARIAHGLCVRCGVAPYTTGPAGHNSNTCKSAADKTRWPAGMSEADKQNFQ